MKIRGGMGALLVAAEESDDGYDIISWASAIVDGETIKPDMWYKIENGQFVLADEETEEESQDE